MAFAGYSLLMDYVTSNPDTENLFHPDTNSPWYHLLIPGLFYLMTHFYTDYLRAVGYGWLRWVLPAVFTVLVVINAMWWDGFYAFPSRVVVVYSLTGIVLTVGYFVYLLSTLTELYLERQPMFWIASGLLMFFSANFLLWLSMNYLVVDRDIFYSVYRIANAAQILLNVFFTVAICLNPSTAKERTATVNINSGR